MSEDVPLAERVRRLEEIVSSLQSEVTRLSAAAPAKDPESTSPATPASPPAAVAAPRDFETVVGTYWLSRAGILALISGVAFYVLYHFADFGPLVRVVIGYALSATLAGLGLWTARRYRLFGHVLYGGGLAIAYFVTYALHFVASIRVIDQQFVALGLLGAIVVGIVVSAHRIQSETVAGVALFLGLHSSLLGDTTFFSLSAMALLGCGAVFFLVANRWVIVPLSTLVAVHTTHLVFMIRGSGETEVFSSVVFSALYFVIFQTALLIRPENVGMKATVSFSTLNALGFLLLAGIEVERRAPEHAPKFLLAAAILFAASAALAWGRKASILLRVSLGGLALALAWLAWDESSGGTLGVLWALIGLSASIAGRLLDVETQRVAGAVAMLGALLVVAFTPDVSLLSPLALTAAFAAMDWLSPKEPKGPWRRLDQALDAFAAGGAALSFALLLGAILPKSITVLAWGLAAFAASGVGFALRARRYRMSALVVLALTLVRLVFWDLARLGTDQRILTFVLLGVVLLATSFAYTRWKKRATRSVE